MAAADNKLNFKSYSVFIGISGTVGGHHVAQSRIREARSWATHWCCPAVTSAGGTDPEDAQCGAQPSSVSTIPGPL